MYQVENYIYKFDGSQREIKLYFYRKLTDNFNLTAKIKYKTPFFYGNSWICYLN